MNRVYVYMQLIYQIPLLARVLGWMSYADDVGD